MKNPRGFTLIEMSFVIAIIGLLLVAAGTKLRDYAVESSGEKLGNEAATLLGSVNTYTAQYFEEIMNGTAVPGVANNLTPTIAELKVVGGLSASFPVKNSQNTGWTIRIDNRVPAGCVPPACDIESLVSTDAGILDLDGTGVPALKVLGSAMKRMESNGVRAGISDETAPGTISGQGASWTAPNPAGNVAGVLAAKGGFGSSGYSQFVRMGDSRDVTLSGALTVNGANGVTATKVASNGTLTVAGQTTLTGAATLNSTLAVGGATTLNGALAANNGIITTTVVASGRVTAQYLLPSATVIGTTACSPNGLIAKDATGRGMVCVSGKWVLSSTKPCVLPDSVSYTTAGVHQLIIPENCTITVTSIGGGGGGGSASYWNYGCLGKGGCSDIEAFGGSGGGKGYSASATFYRLNQTYVYVVVGSGGGGGAGPARGNGYNGGRSYISYANTQSAAASAPQVAAANGGSGGFATGGSTHTPAPGGAGGIAGVAGLPIGYHTTNPSGRCLGGAGGGAGSGKGGNGGSGTQWAGCSAPGAAGSAGSVTLSWN